MDVRFWCAALEVPWSWTPRAYPGVWLMVLVLVLPYLIVVHRRHRNRSGSAQPTNPQRKAQRRQLWFYLAGVGAFWLASDWPLGLLGASYLAAAHMVQFMIYTLVAAPLLLLGTPEWLARRLVERFGCYRRLGKLSHPVMAGVLFNAVLLLTHSPWAVDTLRVNQFGSFAMDLLWLASGLLVWLPIISPLTEQRMKSYPAKMTYMFLAMGVVPAVPAGFMTFAGFPLYATYELAPRVHGLDATVDQQLAGLIMKLGGIPIVWGTIVAMMLRWADQTRRDPAPRRPPAVPSGGPASAASRGSAPPTT